MTKDEALDLALRSLKELVPDESDYAPAIQGQRKRQEKAITAIKQALAQPVQSLPFGVGGGLVAIKTLLSRDPCVHANTAIEMLDAILKEHPAAQPAPVQEPVATLWQHGETGRTRITMPGDITDCDARWFKAADLYTTPPTQPVPVQAVEPVEATDEIIFHGLEAFNRRTHKTYGTGNTRKLTPEERMTRAYYAMRVGIIQPAAQQEMTVVDPADWVPCTPEWINQGGDCAKSPRVWNAKECNHYHPSTPPAAQPAVPLTDEQKRDLIKKSALWDMHIHIGWYSAPAKSFVEKTIQLIADIEAAHGITKGQP
jgi:hypothetical protein